MKLLSKTFFYRGPAGCEVVDLGHSEMNEMWSHTRNSESEQRVGSCCRGPGGVPV